MSIQSEIDRIGKNVNDTLSVIAATGVDVGAGSDALPAAALGLANVKQDKLTGTQGQFVGFDADGQPEAQDAPTEVFVATYGTTTFEEIKAAYNAGKFVYCGRDDILYVLYALDRTNSIAAFIVLFGHTIKACMAWDSKWVDAVDTTIEITNNKTTSLSTNSTDEQYPSAKAVYDVLEAMKPKAVSVTLTAAGWSDNTQTVTVSGVLADETKQLIQPMPSAASQAAYIEAGILCTGQAANSLTFTAETAPTADLTVFVVITEVTA